MCAVAYNSVCAVCNPTMIGCRTTILPLAHLPAFRVKDRDGLEQIRHFVEVATALGRPPSAVLLDSFVDGQMGGTGHKAPWPLLAGFDLGVPIILAGGLTPDNVAEAISLVRPWGVDVASGVESAPGRKDPSKMAEFVRNAGPRLHRPNLVERLFTGSYTKPCPPDSGSATYTRNTVSARDTGWASISGGRKSCRGCSTMT